MWQEFAAQTFGAAVYDPRYFGDDGDRRWGSAAGAAAWIRQCLTQASESGAVCVLMPAAAASSTRARPLRRTLLRTGILRALVTGIAEDRDLWLLHETDGERPQFVLLIDTAGNPSTVAAVWQAFRADPAHPEAARFAARIIDRLDEYVDLTPDRPAPDDSGYSVLRAAYLEKPMETPPALEPHSTAYGVVTLGELVDAGMVSIHRSPPTVAGDGPTPMLTAKDIRLGRPASRSGDAGVTGAVLARAGDVVLVGSAAAVGVCTGAGLLDGTEPATAGEFADGRDEAHGGGVPHPEFDVLLGPGVDLLRTDTAALDPEFLAGVLRAALDDAQGGDIDLHAVGIPRLPPAEQRRCAKEFARLRSLEASWLQRRTAIEDLVRLGYRGLATGRLRPGAGE